MKSISAKPAAAKSAALRRHITAVAFATSVATCLVPVAAPAADYHQRREVRVYLAELVDKHSFDRARLEMLFSQVTKQTRAIKAIQKPAEAKPWPDYRDIFLTRKRVNGGVRFWRQHRELLQRASDAFTVPPEIIVAIIGIETFYGRITGSFPVLDTLVTLGFDYPRRAAFFRNELTEFLLLCRQESFRCTEARGSYAGAMGIGQFIASSYRAYAVDFNKDGTRNLWTDMSDAVGSVANFLVRHGWSPRAPINERVELVKGEYDDLLNRELRPWLSLSDLSGRGISTGGFRPKEELFSLFSFEQDDGGRRIWAGYHNFFVITRYNHSYRYAMAVHQLSEMIKRDYLARSSIE